MEDSEGGGKSYVAQSFITSLLIGLGIIALIGFVAFLFVPELLIYILIICAIIFILRGKWVKKHPLIQLILLLALIGIILFVVATTLLTSVGLISEREYSGFVARMSESRFRLLSSNFSLFGQWRTFQDRQVAIATGEYFTGEVEESQEDQDLGLHLERLESSGMNLIEGREAVFWTTLKGKTLGNQLINGLIGCNASEGDDKRITQSREFSIFSYEMEQYECRFSSLPGGKSIKINFWAEYDFRTLGYTRAYFIDQERLRTLRSMDRDPLQEAGIRERFPVSIYTDGPINIGIGTSDYQPIPVRDNHHVTDTDRLFILGVTLQAKPTWKGKINRINNLEIQIHKSMFINPTECDHNFEETDNQNCKNRCEGNNDCETECNEYNFYRLSNPQEIDSISNYRTFRCPVKTYLRDDLLGNMPVSTRFIRVIADYNFRTELDRIFFVRKEDDIN